MWGKPFWGGWQRTGIHRRIEDDNARGEEMTSMVKEEDIETVNISKTDLDKFRAKFPVWKDADKFDII